MISDIRLHCSSEGCKLLVYFRIALSGWVKSNYPMRNQKFVAFVCFVPRSSAEQQSVLI